MSDRSQWETLYLWHLIGRGGTAPWKDRPASSSIQAKDRRTLEKRGLITVSKGPKGAFSVEVTDEGWAWASGHLQSTLPESKGAANVLRDWMAAIDVYLKAHRLALGDLFVTHATDTPPAPSDNDALLQRIRAAYLEHTNGLWRTEVRLSKLKEAFSESEHAAVDEALIALARQGDAELLPIDDPLRLHPEDAAAALTIAGERRHLVFLHPGRS